MTKTGLIATVALVALLGGCNQGAEAPAKTVQQLMAEDVQPTAEIFWNSVQFISDETGDHDIKPETDADWKKTRDAATRIGELGALLQTPAYTEGRGEDWTQFAKSLVDVSKLAEQAADAKDPDKVFEIGGTMYNVCSACHQVYPATTGPEAEEQAAG
jgi:cytochrome c556